MALGTPIDRGTAQRGYSGSNLVSATFTPSADSFMLALVVIKSSGATADSITGHDAGTSWVQIGTTQAIANLSVSLWGAHSGSSPSSGAITVAKSTTFRMQCNFAEITGADVSGTVANSFVQTNLASGYGTTINATLTGATNLTLVGWGETGFSAGSPDAPEVQLSQVDHSATNQNSTISYDTGGNTTPSYSNVGPRYNGYIAVEFKVGAASVTATLSGTATATIDEDDITTGGKTIIITLVGDTWKAAGTGPIGSTADTQALIDGFDAASSPTNGWDNEVRDKALTSEIVRTSATVATWTISAQAGYDISAQEVITGTIPTAALTTGAGALTATPTFTIDPVSGFQAAWARSSNAII